MTVRRSNLTSPFWNNGQRGHSIGSGTHLPGTGSDAIPEFAKSESALGLHQTMAGYSQASFQDSPSDTMTPFR